MSIIPDMDSGFNGAGYRIVVKFPQDKIFRYFTSDREYAPDAQRAKIFILLEDTLKDMEIINNKTFGCTLYLEVFSNGWERFNFYVGIFEDIDMLESL